MVADCLERCRSHSRQTQSTAGQASSDRKDTHHRIDRKHYPEVCSVDHVGRYCCAHKRVSTAASKALERGCALPRTRSMWRLRSAIILDGKECPWTDCCHCKTAPQWRRQNH